jgi:prolyl oligopeptidase
VVATTLPKALLTLRSDWQPPGCGRSFKAGSLLSAPMARVMASDWSGVTALFEPTPSKSLSDTTHTKDYLVLKQLEHVRTKLVFWRYDSAAAEGQCKWALETAAEAGEAVAVGEDVAVASMSRNAEDDNAMWLFRDGYLVPDSQEATDAANGCTQTEVLRTKPAMFDASALTVSQHFATSLDGTKVPYFVMHRKDMPLDGSNCTLVDAYGGFEIAMLPGYSAGVGAGWLERGGVKVIANVRGGGEYGPSWHQAALREKRHKAYEDVEAVGQDLVARGISSPAKLAVIGGSNGGLMVGNMICRPVSSALFGAAVCQVPLLDMKGYSHLLAGASWMAEFGDPDTADWPFLRRHSAYHLLRHDCLGLPELDQARVAPSAEGGASDGSAYGGNPPTDGNPEWRCPTVLFTTSTRDDRVHPAHARKMVRALETEATKEQAPQVYYWENVEGGHGGAADNKQRAHMWALTYGFLAKALGLQAEGPGSSSL